MMVPCHQAKAAVQRSEPSGLGRLLASLGFDSYTVSRYGYGVEKHHHDHGKHHDGHHKDHDKDGHHHDGHHGHHGQAEDKPALKEENNFVPPPSDAEVRILPIFGHSDEKYAEKHVEKYPQGYRGGAHGGVHGGRGGWHGVHGAHGHHRHAAAHRALSAVLYRLDRAGEAVTAFIRSLRFNTVYLIVGYIVGGALGFVAARKIRQARNRRRQIRLDEEEAAAAAQQEAQPLVVDEKVQA